MKLKIPVLYSQRDTRWKDILLGYNTSTYTIGGYGCLITSLGDYINKTPIEVNQILKAGEGYQVGGGLFVWSKCNLLGLTQTYVSPSYADGPVSSQGINKIKELLDQGYPLLCEIDFNPATVGEEMHFVLVIGYEEPENILVADPWTGQVISLDVYGGARRSIIQFRAYDKILPLEGNDDALSACMKDREMFWKERDEWKSKYEDMVDQYNQLNSKYTLAVGEKENLQKQLNQAIQDYANLQNSTNQQITGLNEQVNSLTIQAEQLKTQVQQLEEAIANSDNELQQEINKKKTEIEGLNKRIDELVAEKMNQPKFEVVFKNTKLKLALIKFNKL